VFGSDYYDHYGSAAKYAAALGKTIQTARLDEGRDRLELRFTDGTGIEIWDDAQSCCEHRYMTTDYTLSDFDGAVFLGAEIKDGPSIEDNWECHDVQFLEIKTSVGEFVMATHNEHNGYYGGFIMRVTDLAGDN